MTDTDHNGATALGAAAAGVHEAVAKQLLAHGADVAPTDHTGVTALMAAAAGSDEAVAKHFLDYGAGLAAASRHGEAVLMLAVQGGHEAVAELIAGPWCGCGRRKPRMISQCRCWLLHVAGDGEAMAKLLLDQGADVAGAGHNDFTALMVRAVDNRQTVAKLLLDHGAMWHLQNTMVRLRPYLLLLMAMRLWPNSS